MPLSVSSNHELDNLKMECELCQEIVIYGDGYINHLREAHNIKRNFAKLLEKKSKNNGEVEVIDIDDDDDEEDTAMISQEEEETLGEREIPADVKEEAIDIDDDDMLASVYEIMAEYDLLTSDDEDDEEDTAMNFDKFASFRVKEECVSSNTGE